MNRITKQSMNKYLLVVITTLSIVLNLKAHSVYIEPNEDGELIARFGEFGDDPETSPGFLDQLDGMTAWTIQEKKKPVLLQPEKKKDRFNLSLSSRHDAEVQTGFPIMTRGSSPARKPHFYARWTPSLAKPADPAMTLDIVPTGNEGEARVFFRNKPLAGVELTLFTPDANDQDLKSDADGFVRFKSDEKGLFMLKLGRYREDRVGFDRGKLHQLVSHNCSLTWIQH